MSADHDSRLPPGPEPGDDFEDDDAPRSIFAATWFRVVLVLVGVAIVGAVAVPYVLDAVNPPATPVIAVANPRAVSGTAPATPNPKAPATSSEDRARPSTLAQAPPAAPAQALPAAPAQAPATAPAPTTSAPPSASAPPPATAPAKPRETTAAPTMPKPSAPTEAAKPAVPAKEAEKATTKPPVAQAERPAAPRAAAGGDYFVQVGAYKDPSTAKRVAASLRAQNYPVEESVKRVGGATIAEAPRPAPRAPATTSSGADRYDVIVTGGTPAEINTKLAAKGLAVEPVDDGVRIRPSLPLRDAVALSKDLNNDGFKVQVRRGGGAPMTTTPAPVRPPTVSDADGGGETLHRVRVGGYADRATAQDVLRALQGKGYQPYIAKGRE